MLGAESVAVAAQALGRPGNASAQLSCQANWATGIYGLEYIADINNGGRSYNPWYNGEPNMIIYIYIYMLPSWSLCVDLSKSVVAVNLIFFSQYLCSGETLRVHRTFLDRCLQTHSSNSSTDSNRSNAWNASHPNLSLKLLPSLYVTQVKLLRFFMQQTKMLLKCFGPALGQDCVHPIIAGLLRCLQVEYAWVDMTYAIIC